MAKPKLKTPKKKLASSQSRLIWYGVGAAIVLFVVLAIFISRATAIPFELTGGDDNPLILLRNETTVNYEFTYTGRSPARLERLIPRIQLYKDQVLVADVQRVWVEVDGKQVELEEGYLPDEPALELQPGDTFNVGVIYLGQELGWNRIYGFRIQYRAEGESIDAQLELEDDYYVFVE